MIKKCKLLVVIILISSGCSENHLIRNREYRNQLALAFQERRELAVKRDSILFSIFDNPLPEKEKEALSFMYAYMPLSDLADYSGSFHYSNVKAALKALDEAPWRDSIPDDIFLHYILPQRVNNENLDSFRLVCYDEIKNRIKGLDLISAALEINHWCHEKVSYQPADIRTSAPLSTMLSARGRCGEESTFTVAALRTAGIPARQVYTPRWAHSDDNHAWVEVWHNGTWYYMGACEPEPVLDRGWFTEPARRAMLVHTKSFGAPYGNENAVKTSRNYVEVNNLSKYAAVKKIHIRVSNKAGMPENDALVEFQLYNYAEFYPLASLKTDDSGLCSFETGFGDLIVWARKDGYFGFKKISVANTDTLNLALLDSVPILTSFRLDLDVPAAPDPFPGLPEVMVKANNERVASENLIRQKYIDTWMKPEEAESLSLMLRLDPGRVVNIVKKSMGNYAEIVTFLKNTPDSLRDLALEMLEILPDKDLRDTRSRILEGHIKAFASNAGDSRQDNKDLYLSNVVNPRIANEILSDWRTFFRGRYSSDFFSSASHDPMKLVAFIDENVILNDVDNYYKTPITPAGVIDLGVSDTDSRAICFIALCRTAGIPARLEPGTNVPQYFKDNEWNNVWFADQEKPVGGNGFIRLVSEGTNPEPEYYTHFTLARFEDGKFNTLEYDYNLKIKDIKSELSLQPGYYMLVTGNRLSDGRILSEISFFLLEEGEHKVISVSLRKRNSQTEVLGRIDLNEIFPLFSSIKTDAGTIDYESVVIIWTEPESEPSKHVFNDLPLLKKELDEWGGLFLFLSGTDSESEGFNRSSLKNLPENSLFSADPGFKKLERIRTALGISNTQVPLVLLSDRNGNVTYISSGYRIGLGEHLLKNK